MKVYEKFNNIKKSLLFPFLFGSIFISIGEILQLAELKSFNTIETVFENFSQLLYKLIPYFFCYYFAVMPRRGKKFFSGIWSVLCLAVFSTAFRSLSGSQITIFSGIFVGFIIYYIFRHIEKKYLSLSLTFISCLLLGLLFGFLYEYFYDFNMSLSKFISDKGIISSVLFGIFNTVYSVFDSNTFADMFFNKSFGGSVLIENDLVTGVKELLSSGYEGKLISTYLSGHYYLLFATVGVCIALIANKKGIQRKVLFVISVATVLSGNLTLAFVFLFFESPAILISLVVVSALSYASAYLIDLGAGYLHSGGIFEMFVYHGEVVYLLAGGTVFLVIGYFVCRYCCEKYGISDCFNIYYPDRLKYLVNALGGEDNIIRFKDSNVEVRNPKLVNTIILSCEINENVVTSDSASLKQLREYYDEYQR